MRYAISLVLTILVLFVSGVIYTNAKAQTPNQVLEYYASAPVIQTMYCQNELVYVTANDPTGKTIWRGVPGKEAEIRKGLSELRKLLTEQFSIEPFEAIIMMPDAACEDANT